MGDFVQFGVILPVGFPVAKPDFAQSLRTDVPDLGLPELAQPIDIQSFAAQREYIVATKIGRCLDFFLVYPD